MMTSFLGSYSPVLGVLQTGLICIPIKLSVQFKKSVFKEMSNTLYRSLSLLQKLPKRASDFGMGKTDGNA